MPENVKTLLVIGNGFDLAHGLKTKYTDFLNFINTHWKEHIDKTIDAQMLKRKALLNDATLIEAIKIGEENLNFRRQLREIYSREVDNNARNFDLLHRTREEIQQKFFQNSLTSKNILDYIFDFGNIWIKHFNERRENTLNRIGEDWIDFEKEIEGVIENIEKLLLGNKINEVPDHFILQDYDRISPQVMIQKYIPTMAWDLRILTLLLEQYLIEEEKKLKPDTKTFFKNLNPDAVISYNYTHTFQRLYNVGAKIPAHFIHGELGKHDLVLGIGETLSGDEKNNFTVCASFKKFFQRIKYKLGNQYEKVTKIKDNRIIPWQVIIYGHSLDVTDKDSLYWLLKRRDEKKHVTNVSNAIKFIIYYHDENAYNQQIANAIQIIGKDELIESVNSERIVFLSMNNLK